MLELLLMLRTPIRWIGKAMRLFGVLGLISIMLGSGDGDVLIASVVLLAAGLAILTYFDRLLYKLAAKEDIELHLKK